MEVESGTLAPLGRSLTENVTLLKHGGGAWSADWTAFGLERSIGRPTADISLVDVTTGERTHVKDKLIEDHYLQASPEGSTCCISKAINTGPSML